MKKIAGGIITIIGLVISIAWIITKAKGAKRFVTYKEAAELYSIGLTKVQEYAKIAGATYKMGNKVLVNTDIFEAYIEQFRIPGEFEVMAKKFIPDLAGMYR